MKYKMMGLGLVLCLICCQVAEAQDTNYDLLKEKILSKVPKLKGHIQSIQSSGVWDLYEVDTDDHQIIYTDKNVSYLFAGEIYQTTNLENLTQKRLDTINAVAWQDLPLSLAIKRVKGNGQRELVVFSDPDCPYCRRLESELKNINDVTIYTFVYPIASLHPHAPQRSAEIWCAHNRAQAWDEYLLNKKQINKNTQCDVSDLEKVQLLAEKLNINGTPTLIFKNGQKVPGVISANDLEKLLGSH
ncbi:putative thiol:disulfide interchange protein DsbC precursor [Ferrovum sp. JA12]|uniref:DsbC family protein n=1 Tax=Ferrovum sp. JA12 TaxID=1356299 RepID=UPI000702CFAD|nr:DsbC family protein [Ferrovum sp. JA12]KRH79132.1 putative thiol:disulfide interchange protein DsbC precursor [Ferrovum sp. JA12]HQU06042.1 thioredoxin fold domain-containing protein [Ferrovaceae bacterium]